MIVDALKDLTLGELSCLADLPRHLSLRSWAQHHGLGAMAASRLVREVEQRLGVLLLHRSNRGITATSDGEAVARLAACLLQLLTASDIGLSKTKVQAYKRYFTFGSRGFLNVALAGLIAREVEAASPKRGVRVIDLSPEETNDAAKAACIDLCLSPGSIDLGRNWQCAAAGALTWRLYGRVGHPAATGTDVAGLRRFRVGHHSYWNGRQLINSDNLIRDAVRGHVMGHGTQTAAVALSIAAATDLVVCVPDLVAAAWVQAQTIAELPVVGFKPPSVALYLYAEQDRVPTSLFKPLAAAIQRFLAGSPR